MLCYAVVSAARQEAVNWIFATPACNHPPQCDNEHCQEVSADTGHHNLKALLSLLKGTLSKHLKGFSRERICVCVFDPDLIWARRA